MARSDHPSRRHVLAGATGLLGALGLPPAAYAATSPSGEPKHLLVVFAEGGWDVTYCMDPKLSCGCAIDGPQLDEDPDNRDDREDVETFGNIPIVVNPVKRPAVRQFFRNWHSRVHVINGIWTGSIAHDPCRYRILTGTPDGRKPDVTTITGYTHGDRLPLGSIDLSGWGIAGGLAASSGRIGAQSQIAPLIDDGKSFRRATQVAADQYPLFQATTRQEDAIQAFLDQRVAMMRERFSDGGANDRSLDDLVTSHTRAQRFRAEAAGIMDSLAIGQQARFIEQLKMAMNLIEAGLCHSVTVDTRNDWDTHDQNSTQHRYYEELFGALDRLLGELQSRGLMDRVVVAVVSEMTRTPLRNAAGGKDHWGHTSAMLMGAVRGDAVSGATDDQLQSCPVDLATGEAFACDLKQQPPPLQYSNVVAGLLEMVGVDPQRWLPGVPPFRGAHAV